MRSDLRQPARNRRAVTRRRFLRRSLSATAVLGLADLRALAAGLAPAATMTGGTRLEDLPFQLSRDLPQGTLIGDGIDGRLYTDLSRLAPDRLVTPVEEFFIRTALPPGDDQWRPQRVEIGGLVARPQTLAAAELVSRTADRGVHVLECAGSDRLTGFGLISAGRWSGVQLAELLADARPTAAASSLLVEGFDGPSAGPAASPPACSWIFPLRELEAAGAFLATHLDERPLTAQHGAPVRLAVPGWYGCCWVKWMARLSLVEDRQLATPQMRLFALRTHQDGVPELASAYQPATVDLSAMPVRVERWRVQGRLQLRIVGILWGQPGATDRLTIRFAPNEPFVRVTEQPRGAAAAWSLWSHTWTPTRPGRHLIQLAVDDPTIRTRRLDMGFYARGIELDATNWQ